MKRLIQRKKPTVIFLMIFLLGCLALLPGAQAVSPAPDGAYPGGNTAEGQSALFSLTTGGFNTAVGLFSLRNNATNSFNTAVGAGTLLVNTADENTATGAGALLSNTTGTSNTANGTFALAHNTIGERNTATGFQALSSNVTGSSNTASGNNALASNMNGDANTATGGVALFVNTTGFGNTATGFQALVSNTMGSNNTAIGFIAGNLQTTGSNNVYIGAGMQGVAGESNACYIASIYGGLIDPGTGTTALIDSSGKLGTLLSSRRFKHDVKPMDETSEVILALKPVTFHYKSDAKKTPCFGLIAEEVAKVNPDLVIRDKKGELMTVRYEAVNAMLLNEFLKEHKKVEEQQATIAELKGNAARHEKLSAQQQEQIEELTAGLQRVSTQLELSKSAPQTVPSNQ